MTDELTMARSQAAETIGGLRNCNNQNTEDGGPNQSHQTNHGLDGLKLSGVTETEQQLAQFSQLFLNYLATRPQAIAAAMPPPQHPPPPVALPVLRPTDVFSGESAASVLNRACNGSHPVCELNQVSQGLRLSVAFMVTCVDSTPHDPTFRCDCEVTSQQTSNFHITASGYGGSKKEAKTEAATRVLANLKSFFSYTVDTSGEIKAGSFDPYGNQQIYATVSGYLPRRTPDDPNYKFHYIKVSTNTGLQPSVQVSFDIVSVGSSKNGMEIDPYRPAYFVGLAVANSATVGSTGKPANLPEFTFVPALVNGVDQGETIEFSAPYLNCVTVPMIPVAGTVAYWRGYEVNVTIPAFTIPATQALWLVIASTYSGANTSIDAQFALSLTYVPQVDDGGKDVNIVGFSTQTAPVWMSNASPGMPVIATPPEVSAGVPTVAGFQLSSVSRETVLPTSATRTTALTTATSRRGRRVRDPRPPPPLQLEPAVATVDTSDEIKQGFNPYGNGQGSVANRKSRDLHLNFLMSTNHIGDGSVGKSKTKTKLRGQVDRPVPKSDLDEFPHIPSSKVTTAQNPHEYINSRVISDDQRLDAVTAINDVTMATKSWIDDKLGISSYTPTLSLDPRVLTEDDPADDKKPKNSRAPFQPGEAKTRNIPDSATASKETNELPFNKKIPVIAGRIVKRLADWEDALDWLYGGEPPPEPLIREVWVLAERKFGKGVAADARWVVEGIVENRSDKVIFEGLLAYSPQLTAVAMTSGWSNWVATNFSGKKPRAPVRMHSDGSQDARPPSVNCATSPPHQSVSYEVDTSDEIKSGSFDPYGNQQIKASYDYRDDSILEGSFNPYGNGQGTPHPFANSMEDIRGFPSLFAAFQENPDFTNGRRLDPIREIAEITGLRGAAGISASSVPRETVLRASVINELNVITPQRDLPAPEAIFFPLTIRDETTATYDPIDQTGGLPFFTVGNNVRSCLDASRAPTLNATGIAISEILGRMSNLRPDQIGPAGFHSADIAALIRQAQATYGDTAGTPLLKLQLYRLSRAHKQEMSLLPYGSQVSKFDSYTRLAANATSEVIWGDQATANDNFNASCYDGTNYFLPAEPAGTRPRVAFHVTMASVPANEPVYWIPPGLLMQTDRGSESINLALLLLALGPYPFGLHQVKVETEDLDGANPDDQYYIPGSDLVRIPGLNTIHFLLPCLNAGPLPDSIAEAEQLALITPSTGPTAFGRYAANFVLRYSWIGNVVYHDVIDLVGTWMSTATNASPIDVSTLTRFMYMLAETLGRVSEIESTWEMACVLGVGRYPMMYSAAEGLAETQYRIPANAVDADGEEYGLQQQSAFALLPKYYDSLPFDDPGGYDFLMPQTSQMWWNKTCCGAYNIHRDNVALYDPVTPSVWDGNPRLLQYAMVFARSYAATWESVIQLVGQSARVWNSSFTQQNYVGVMKMIRDFFVSGMSTGGSGALVSESGQAVGGLHYTITGYAPASNLYGDTFYDYMNVPVVGIGSACTYAGAYLEDATPCILPDVWLQVTTEKCFQANCQQLSPNKRLVGLEIPNAQVTPLGGGSYSIPCPVDMQAREVGLDVFPGLNDKYMFNGRLTWAAFRAGMYKMDGNIFIGDIPAPSNYITMRWTPADWTTPDPTPPGRLTAKSTWIPYMTSTGLRLIVGVSAADGAARMTQVMAGAATTGVPVWLIRTTIAYPNVLVDGAGGKTTAWVPKRRGVGNASTSLLPDSQAGHSEPPQPPSMQSLDLSESTA